MCIINKGKVTSNDLPTCMNRTKNTCHIIKFLTLFLDQFLIFLLTTFFQKKIPRTKGLDKKVCI